MGIISKTGVEYTDYYNSSEFGDVVFYVPHQVSEAPVLNYVPENRKYRVICVNVEDNKLLYMSSAPSWKYARVDLFDCDEIFDYPIHEYWIERSLDDGVTWYPYYADEFINGCPAWTINGL